MAEPNKVMKDVIDTITWRPEGWKQDAWVDTVEREEYCGTTMCIAGWASVLSGVATLKETKNEKGKVVASTIVWPEGSEEGEPGQELDEDEFLNVGMDVLDLDDIQARSIFHQTNITDPQQMVNHIKRVLETPGAYVHATDEVCTC